jgi:hypothetical protein
MTRTRLVSAALLAALALAVAGCQTATPSGTGDGTTPAPATSAPADAKTVLTGTAAHFDTTSFNYTITSKDESSGDGTASGSFDPAADARSLKLQQTAEGFKITIDYRIVGDKRYLHLGGIPGFPAKFMKIDGTKISANADKSLSDLEGPAKVANVFEGIVSVTDAGGGKYTGTVDMTKSVDAMIADESDIKGLGDKAKAVPFEATVDAMGRLTSLKLTLDPGKSEFAMTFTDWGSQVKIEEPPASEVVDAPASVYEFLSS